MQYAMKSYSTMEVASGSKGGKRRRTLGLKATGASSTSSTSGAKATKYYGSSTSTTNMKPASSGAWGSSSSTRVYKPASSGGWGEPVIEVTTDSPTNAPTICTPTIELAPTLVPTPSPTTCMEQEFYNAGGICTNEGMTPPGGTAFPTLLECCEETQTANECEFVDICCEMRLWYLSSVSGECTNGFTQDGEFTSLQECCEETQPGVDCLFEDICLEVVETPAPTAVEIVTSEPTYTVVDTPVPTPVEIIVTPAPTTCMEQEYYTAGGI
jgi:hypothetical protein